MGFVHLHCHSAYSLLEGTATPQALVGMAKKLQMPALALTDRNNLYGAAHFYVEAQKAGIKPIIGMEVNLGGRFAEFTLERSEGLRASSEPAKGSRLLLLPRNMDGYRNLCHMATVLRLNSDPQAFPPAGFDDHDLEGEGEILSSEPGG